MIAFDEEDEAVEIANGTAFGEGAACLSKGAGSAASSSFQYSTGLSPLKDRQRGTASPGARRDEPVRVTSWTQPAPKPAGSSGP